MGRTGQTAGRTIYMENEQSLELEYATLDLDRDRRTGMQEVIYCGHKSSEQINGIVQAMLDKKKDTILLTRLSEQSKEALEAALGEGHTLFYDKDAGIGVVDWVRKEGIGNITIVCAGTSDMPVVMEAAITAEVMGNKVVRINDVGVAGIHRLLSKEEEIKNARVIIVVAGMEGALASVIGGLVRCPVIAVPTSVGYGANFGGLSALLSMLNSCAGGVSVVNIDNGFGAAVCASRINHMVSPD